MKIAVITSLVTERDMYVNPWQLQYFFIENDPEGSTLALL